MEQRPRLFSDKRGSKEEAAMDKHEEARRMSLEALQAKLPESLFADPVEYVFADHFRQRTLCKILDEIADAETLDTELVAACLEFLQSEFGPHVLDEEEDLFPLLRRRATADDDINQVLGQLCEEHASDEADAREIMNQFSILLEDHEAVKNLDDPFREQLKRFASNERQHLTLENAIVLPLARVRLSETDCKNLGKRMAARRGIDLSRSIQ